MARIVRLASIIVMAAAISFAAGCGPKTSVAKLDLDSPSVPIGFKFDSGSKYCRFGWLRFSTEYEHDAILSREGAVDLLKQCAIPIADARFLAEAVLRPAIAATDASIRFSACVTAAANKHLKINRVEVGVNASDWRRCYH
jgi:hypothetical protein